ncbi:MAG: NAD(P)-binding protein, partial [Rhodospirillaceae bacterium]|nr:NAD(P)-binding protein [Rhodospirillaceae bacterium]
MTDKKSEILIIGGGIGGLTLALALHKRGIPCRIFEAAPEFKPLGVGINMMPHPIR